MLGRPANLARDTWATGQTADILLAMFNKHHCCCLFARGNARGLNLRVVCKVDESVKTDVVLACRKWKGLDHFI